VGRLLVAMLRFPLAGRDTPLFMTIEAEGATERWTHEFAGRRFSGIFRPAERGRLTEQVGPLTLVLDVSAHAAGLRMAIVGWRLGPVALPRRFAPKLSVREGADEAGRVQFDVVCSLPGLGRLVAYQGWLVPALIAAGDPGH
jgi:hypothetical protein